MGQKMVLPLAGVRILDFSQAMMAPLGAAMLGDMGASVIKVERLAGEAIRYGVPAGMDSVFKDLMEGEKPLDAGVWMGHNRNKRSLAVDLKHEEGRKIILKLVKKTDVFLQNFRPGVMDRLGLGYKDVSEINPRIIYCSVYGFGEKGPLAHKIGGDMWSQAMGGMISQMGTPGGPPFMIPFFLIDHAGAILTAYAIILALFARERTGIGQEIAVNQLDTAMHLQTTEISNYMMDGISPTKTCRGTSTPMFAPYRAKDGELLAMLPFGPAWHTFCKVLGIEHLEDDPRFDNDLSRISNMEELHPLLDEAFGKKTRAEWQQLLKEVRLRCDPCLTYEELSVHPQVEANEMIVSLEHPVQGKIKMLGVPVKLKRTPGKPQLPPPILGQHTREILTELGYTSRNINELKEEGVVKEI